MRLQSQGRQARVSSPAGGGQGLIAAGVVGSQQVVAAGNGLHLRPTGEEKGEPWWQDSAGKALGGLGWSPDSGTHSCVIFCSLLSLSEPQILCLIWELRKIISPGRAVPWFTLKRVKCLRQCQALWVPARAQTLPWSARGAPKPSAQAPEAKLQRVLGEGAQAPASSLGSECDQPQHHKTIKMLITREPATQ